MRLNYGSIYITGLILLLMLFAGTITFASLEIAVPNGTENEDSAWISGVPYDVVWTWSGEVSSNLVLEYSIAGTNGTWELITDSAYRGNDGTGVYHWALPPLEDLEHTNCYVRISDTSTNSIDISDSAFSILQKFRLLVPNGGEKWYLGQTNSIVWESASTLAAVVNLYAASDGTNYDYEIVAGYQNTNSITNIYSWVLPPYEEDLLSSNASLRVTKPYFGAVPATADESDDAFTIAGLSITLPNGGTKAKKDSIFSVEWYSWEAGDFVNIDLSTDGGSNYTSLASAVGNTNGHNTFDWSVEGKGTDSALIRITSISDSNAVAYTPMFTLASIGIIAPSNDARWLRFSSQEITWESGGAGDFVDIFYSTDDGDTWSVVAEDVPNNGTHTWGLPEYVSREARIKVASRADTNLFAVSDWFNMTGARVTYPNSPAHVLDRGVTGLIDHNAAPDDWGDAKIEISYDDQGEWETLYDIWNAGDAALFTPTYPTIRLRAKVTLISPPADTNILDVSDVDCVVAGVLVVGPTNGALYNIDSTEDIDWISAGAGDKAEIFYSDLGTNNFVSITPGQIGNRETYPGDNNYPWPISRTLVPSEDARIKVVVGDFEHTSPQFTVRGLRCTHPSDGTLWDIGSSPYIRWVTAGLHSSVRGTIALSLDGGNNYNEILATDFPLVDTPLLNWPIDADTMPTTEAIMKFTIQSSDNDDDTNVVAVSDIFTLKGLLVVDPLESDHWQLGTTEDISFVSAAQGTEADIYYSSDGGVTWDEELVTESMTVIDGTNTHEWAIETDRKPATNAMLKVEIGETTALSKPFRLGGIRVDRPLTYDIWAVDQTNDIRWIGVGTSGSYDIRLLYEDSSTYTIDQNVSGNSLDWKVLLVAAHGQDVVSNVVLEVEEHGGGIKGVSAPFKIVKSARIEIEEPKTGDFWSVGEDEEIVWLKGGDMNADEFRVTYWPEGEPANYKEINDIVTYHAENNSFTIPWNIPDELGPTRIAVRNEIRPELVDTTGVFNVSARFRVTVPNGEQGDDAIHSLEPITVEWGTVGSATNVNLYYKYDGGSWQSVSSNSIPSSGSGKTERYTSTEWVVPNVQANEMLFRVQDANYSQVFDGTEVGPYDDSDNPFPVSYYQVQWDVGYMDTMSNSPVRKPLDKLRVYDSSGWAESNLTCIGAGGLTEPIIHLYPYGIYDTVWYRDSFRDEIDFHWVCNSNSIRQLTMSLLDASGYITHYVAVDSTNAVFPYLDWTTAATTIQDAVDASDEDDIVLVSNGWYNTGGAVVGISCITNRVAITKAIEVRSVNGSEYTFIAGQDSAGPNSIRCAYLVSGAILRGMTLTNGHTRISEGPINDRMGGGAWCESEATILDCVIVGCSAEYGGGIAYGRIWNSLLEGNNATYGGGAYAVDIRNCTIVANTATTGGGTAFSSVKNSIVYQNSATTDSNCHDGTCIWSCSVPDKGEQGSITNPPLFYDSTNRNYRLHPQSPCINTGMNEYWMSEGTDLDGYLRIFEEIVDMGAYEWTDTDNDLLSDWEEDRIYGTSPDNSDTDYDGMPDAWEVNHALNALINDAAIDTDSDAMSNLEEFGADTNPQDAGSLLRVTFVGKEWGGRRVEWQGGVDAWQFIEATDDLEEIDGWSTIYGLEPPTPVSNAVIIFQGAKRQFYRVMAERE